MTLVTCFRLFRIVFATTLALALAFPAGAQPPPPPFNPQPLLVEIWSGWEDLDGAIGWPVCVASQSNRLDCFASQQGGAGDLIGRRRWNGTAWVNWTSFGGVPIAYDPPAGGASRPECVSWGPDHIDCFVRRQPDMFLFRRTMEGAYTSGYEALAGPKVGTVASGLASDPSCVSTAPRLLDCFAAGSDGQLHHISFDGDLWGPWIPRGGQIRPGTKPSCVVYRGGNHCVTVKMDHTLQLHRYATTGSSVTPTTPTLVEHPIYFGYDPSPRCVASPGSGPGNDVIQCFAPMYDPNSGPALGRWLFDGSNWSVSSIGNIPTGATYDWDCVSGAGERVDCVELVGQPSSPLPTIRVTFRHIRLAYALSTNWSTVSLNPVAGSAFPAVVRCARWGPDRLLDCFAGGSFLATTRLWHARLALGRPPLPEPRPIR